jgi:Holliday junction resolvase RusA-like endonuclease
VIHVGTLTIPGAPPSSQQKQHGNGKVWQSDAHTAYMARARPAITKQWGRRPVAPKGQPVHVCLTVWYPIPKNWRKAERAAANGAFKCSTPDADNLAKTVGDALQHIVCEDDASIQWVGISRRYGIDLDEAYSIVSVSVASPEALPTPETSPSDSEKLAQLSAPSDIQRKAMK